MESPTQAAPARVHTTLPALSARWLAAQAILLAVVGLLAVALPALAHAVHLPVRWLLPMHWPVLLAGLACGAWGGALVGMLAPTLSWAVSGMPLPAMLPAMTVELATYGLVCGLLRGRFGARSTLAVAGAIGAGRLVFVAMAWATGVGAGAFGGYLQAALVPGLAAAAGQVLLLPPLADYVVGNWARRSPRQVH